MVTVAIVRRRLAVVVACMALGGCTGDRSDPRPTSTEPAPTTTTRVPVITAGAIPRLTPTAIHDKLRTIGFTTTEPSASGTSFVTITSKRADATVSTYGRTPAEVAKVVAEADRPVAASVLAVVAVVALQGAEVARAQTWLTAELKKGASGPAERKGQAPPSTSQPRVAKATYGGQPYELVITAATATLSIGRLTTA